MVATEVVGTDTTWTTYTSSKVWTDRLELSTSTLISPILSSSSLDFWDDMTGSVTREDDSVVVVSLSSGPNKYEYKIDKVHWVITSVLFVSKDPYGATYYWAFDGDLAVLTMIALSADTSLKQGGFRFSNIRINGNVSVHDTDRSRHYASAWSQAAGVLPTARSNLLGRRMGGHRGSGLSAGRVSAGVYVIPAHQQTRRPRGTIAQRRTD